MAEMIISERAMQAAPRARDLWLIEHGARGTGRLVGRITPAGERRFYYRYTDSRGNRVRLLIGAYDPRGDGGTTFTVKQARCRAVEWQTLHAAGVRDLREHFAQELRDAERAREDARGAAEAARRMAEEAAQADALAQQRRLTMRQVFDRWAATELAPHVGGDGRRIGRKDGGQYVREQFERRVFPGLGHVAVEDVRKADVLAILDAAKAEGKLRTANMLLADLKQMFRFAAEREIIEHSPIELIRKKKIGGKDIKRDRVLSGDELSALFKQLPTANLNRRTVLGIWLILATGCRVGEMMGAVWADAKPHKRALQKVVDAHNVAQKSGAVQLGFVDVSARTWYLPTTKNQRDHTIHLSEFALKQIAELAALRETDRVTGAPLPWVFPNSSGNGPVCIKSFGKQLADRQRSAEKRLTNRTKAVDALVLAGGRWTAHDLRRSASTLMSQLGVSNDVINECQNHVKQGMSGVYIRDRRVAEQARAFDALGERLAGIGLGETPASNVVSIRAA